MDLCCCVWLPVIIPCACRMCAAVLKFEASYQRDKRGSWRRNAKLSAIIAALVVIVFTLQVCSQGKRCLTRVLAWEHHWGRVSPFGRCRWSVVGRDPPTFRLVLPS